MVVLRIGSALSPNSGVVGCINDAPRRRRLPRCIVDAPYGVGVGLGRRDEPLLGPDLRREERGQGTEGGGWGFWGPGFAGMTMEGWRLGRGASLMHPTERRVVRVGPGLGARVLPRSVKGPAREPFSWLSGKWAESGSTASQVFLASAAGGIWSRRFCKFRCWLSGPEGRPGGRRRGGPRPLLWRSGLRRWCSFHRRARGRRPFARSDRE